MLWRAACMGDVVDSATEIVVASLQVVYLGLDCVLKAIEFVVQSFD